MESWGFAPAALMLLALSCYGLGRVLLSLAAAGAGAPAFAASARIDGDDWFASSRRPDWAMALGATVAAGAIVLLGLIGLLNAAILWGMTLAGALAAVAYLLVFDRLGESPQPAATATHASRKPWAPGPTALPLLGPVAVSGAVVVLAMLLISQAPPTNDDVLRPLESAQRWLLQSRVVFDADDPFPGRNDAVALLPHAWLAWALTLGGPETARGLGVLWALALAAAAARWAGGTLGRRFALPAGCLTLLAPGVIGGALSLNPALPAAALALLAFDGLGRLDAGRCSRPGPAAVLCGIVLGGSLHAAALPTVLLALLWAAARSLDAPDAPRASDQREKPPGRSLMTWAAAAALAVSATVHLAVLAVGGTIDFTLGPAAATAAAANHPAAPWGGPSIAVVLLLPMALGLPQPAALRPLRIALSGYLLLMAPAIALPETYLPLIVVLILPALGAVNRVGQMSAVPQRCIVSAATVGMAATVAAVLWHWAPAVAAACGGDREEYLLRRQPHWSIAAAADRMLPPEARLLTPTDSGFYFRRQTTSFVSLLRKAIEQEVRWDDRLLAAQLRSAGLTHVLTVRFGEPQAGDLPSAIARLNALLLRAAEGPNPWPCVLDLASSDRRMRYQIWRIPD